MPDKTPVTTAARQIENFKKHCREHYDLLLQHIEQGFFVVVPEQPQ